MTHVQTPFTRDFARKLKAGEKVLISGTIYAARDAAHKRLIDILEAGGKLPFDIENQVIYYAGPCPPKPGCVIGSAGPTTSGRMDKYTPALIKKGLTGMIGKGTRSDEVVECMRIYGAVYFAAIGGAGVLIARAVKRHEVIAFPELGTEAVHSLIVKDFPAVVAIDSEGNNLYIQGRNKYGSTLARWLQCVII